VVLETALLAAQDRLYSGDLRGATALLDDIEAALDMGGEFTRPSLSARKEIVDLVAAQDRAVLRADASAYGGTLDPASALARQEAVQEALHPPFTAYFQEIVRLDLADDGTSAEGMILLHADVVEGGFAGDGQLRAVSFVNTPRGWRIVEQRPEKVVLSLPAVSGD
jgi:hypothetical protein